MALTTLQIISPARTAAVAATPTPPAPIAVSHKTPEEQRGRAEATVAPLRLSARRYYYSLSVHDIQTCPPLCTEVLEALKQRTQFPMSRKVLLKRISDMGVRLVKRMALMTFVLMCALIGCMLIAGPSLSSRRSSARCSQYF